MNVRPCLLLLRKDLVRLAVLFLPAVLLMWADRFIAFGTVQPTRTFNDFGLWTTVLQWPLIVLVGMALGNEDRAIGEQTFWRTRPLPPSHVLLAKLLALGLTLVLPAAAIEFVRALQHDVSAALAAAMAAERVATVGLVGAIALLLGASTPSLLRAIMAVVALVAAALLFLLADQQFEWVKAIKALRFAEVSAGSRLVAAFVTWSLATFLLLHLVYHHARARLVLVGGPVALVSGLLVGQFWFVQLVAEPHDTPSTPTTAPTDLPRLQLRSDDKFGIFQRTAGRFESSSLAVPAVLHPDSDAFAAEVLSAESILTFPSGTTHTTRWSNPYFSLPLTTARDALRQEIGLPARPVPVTKADWDLGHRPRFLIGKVPNQVLAPWQGQRATLTSRVQVRFSRLRIAATLPLQRGASWAENGVRLQVLVPPHRLERRFELPLLQSRATSLLHPADSLRPDRRRLDHLFGFALINRTTQEASLAVQFGYADSSGLGASFDQRILRPRFETVERMRDSTAAVTTPATIDETWLEQAELVIFVSDRAGEIEQALDFGLVEIPFLNTTLPDGTFLRD